MSMTNALEQLLSDVMDKSGIQQKIEIQNIALALKDAVANADHPNGDDAAAIKNETGYDLLAGEGFLSEFVDLDPWFAGWCGVMVNVSDIAAMGGRPVAVTNTIWSTPSERLDKIYQGMTEASRVFNIPVVGGHTNLRSESNQLAVSIYGRANTLLSSFSAKPGQALVAAVDLRGSFRQPFLNWNAATTAPPKRLRGDLELLPRIAEQGLAIAAKDISQAGILGTCLMLLESSSVGARINLDNIPKPDHVAWLDWLCCFPSFGYLLTTSHDNLDVLLNLFHERDIAACCIGDITKETPMMIDWQDQSSQFWDIDKEALTGFNSHKPIETRRMR